MSNLVEHPLQCLWATKKMEEDYATLLIHVGFIYLELATKYKRDQAIHESVFEFLRKSISQFGIYMGNRANETVV